MKRWFVAVPLFAAACASEQPQNPNGRTPNTECRLSRTLALDLERYTTLSFLGGNGERGPLGLTFAPGDSDRLFVTEQRGVIYVFRKSDPTQSSIFVDLTDRVGSEDNEQGLLGLAFSPDYASSGRFYVDYTNKLGDSVVARHLRDSPDVGNPTGEPILMVDQPYSNHNGGQLVFGPDGMLYIGLGDGGSGGDPENRAQRRSELLGKILRIDVGGTSGSLAYRIPTDNPFVGEAGSRGEIWAFGLRNPWRFSFDRMGGTLWAGDVGQGAYEEIDIITRGGNYGWNLMEGPACRTPGCNMTGLILPVASYDRNQGCSVTGGFVYRGSRLPELQGIYVYGDYCTGTIWGLRKSGDTVSPPVKLLDTSLQITSFGEDAEGELYVVARAGTLHRFIRKAGAPVEVPGRLSETGCYQDLTARTPAKGLVPYEVNAPLWSDGTVKRRFIALQGTDTIRYRADGAWEFPEGTLLIKEFSLERERGNPSSRIPLETRFLLRRGDGWEGYTYQWNDAGTDAMLLDGSVTKSYSTTEPAGTYTHVFPGRADCDRCHTSAAGGTLGLQTLQLNRDRIEAGRTFNQLDEMQRLGLFEAPGLPGAASTLPRLPDPYDVSQPIEVRARAYLHANCANCHLPGGPTPTNLDLRFTTSLTETRSCGVAPSQGDLGVAGAKILTPGMPDHSILWLRMSRRGMDQMPPLATRLIDTPASTLIADWITSLAGCN